MIEINLIPDVKQELIKARQTRTVVVGLATLISLISIGVVLLLAIYVFTFQTVRNVFADNTIKVNNEKLEQVEDLSKILTIQNQLTKISDLNSNKIISSRIFDVLKVIIPKSPNEVQISKLVIDPSTELVTIEGQAQAGYSALEIFKKTIEGAKLKYKDSENADKEVSMASNVVPGETSYGEDVGGKKVLRFTISFTNAEELFSSEIKNASVVIQGSGNVTDSYLGLPKSVFVERAKDLDEEQK